MVLVFVLMGLRVTGNTLCSKQQTVESYIKTATNNKLALLVCQFLLLSTNTVIHYKRHATFLSRKYRTSSVINLVDNQLLRGVMFSHQGTN